jgi:hypothetical protein
MTCLLSDFVTLSIMPKILFNSTTNIMTVGLFLLILKGQSQEIFLPLAFLLSNITACAGVFHAPNRFAYDFEFAEIGILIQLIQLC